MMTLRPEYDFASMKGGVRGKHYRRIREEGGGAVLLDADVADAFPSEASVNEALRGVLNTDPQCEANRGLPNKALQTTSRAGKPGKSKQRIRAARG